MGLVTSIYHAFIGFVVAIIWTFLIGIYSAFYLVDQIENNLLASMVVQGLYLEQQFWYDFARRAVSNGCLTASKCSIYSVNWTCRGSRALQFIVTFYYWIFTGFYGTKNIYG